LIARCCKTTAAFTQSFRYRRVWACLQAHTSGPRDPQGHSRARFRNVRRAAQTSFNDLVATQLRRRRPAVFKSGANSGSRWSPDQSPALGADFMTAEAPADWPRPRSSIRSAMAALAGDGQLRAMVLHTVANAPSARLDRAAQRFDIIHARPLHQPAFGQ